MDKQEKSIKMVITGKHIAGARGLLGLTVAELAEAAGVHPKTIFRFEAGEHDPRLSTAQALQQALEDRGIEFTNGNSPGAKLRPEKALVTS